MGGKGLGTALGKAQALFVNCDESLFHSLTTGGPHPSLATDQSGALQKMTPGMIDEEPASPRRLAKEPKFSKRSKFGSEMWSQNPPRQALNSPAMRNGRCRMHRGASTGPRTPEGLAKSRRAHGGSTAYILRNLRRAESARMT